MYTGYNLTCLGYATALQLQLIVLSVSNQYQTFFNT